MSVAGILSSAAFSIGAQVFQNRMQNVKQEFQQLGQDLQSGNLSAAQADFATLQKMQPQPQRVRRRKGAAAFRRTSTSSLLTSRRATPRPRSRTYAKLQQDIQSQATQGHHHHHHHSVATAAVKISQLFSQLGTALQSGNLSAAQQAYATMLQNFQQIGQLSALSAQSGTTGISVSA